MEAIEIASLQPQFRPIPKDATPRGVLCAVLFAFCVGIGFGSTPLVSSAGAIANEALDRFTGADRIPRPDLAVSRIGGTPRRPLAAEWRWSPPGVELAGMIREAN